MTTLSEQTLTGFYARGSSGSTLKVTSSAAAIGLILMANQGWGIAALPGKRVSVAKTINPGPQTIGTGAEIVSLRITEQDLAAQLSRVFRTLSAEQVELDADASRILHQNLWSLY